MADANNLDTTALPVELATELTVAWLSNPNHRFSTEDVPAFLIKMHETISGLPRASASDVAAEPMEDHTPAVTARKSLASPDHIISMIDGKPYKTLKRHLSTHGLTPEEYRTRYGLKADYPMVAPAYGEARREMAKRIGLGRKPGTKLPPKAGDTAPAAKPTKASAAKAAAKAHLGGVAEN